MTPDDRWAAIICLAVSVGFATLAMWVIGMIVEVLELVPVVTKDPHTGVLYIPRSDLVVGNRSRRHFNH